MNHRPTPLEALRRSAACLFRFMQREGMIKGPLDEMGRRDLAEWALRGLAKNNTPEAEAMKADLAASGATREERISAMVAGFQDAGARLH